MDVYSDLSYHLLASFGWKIYYGVEDSKFNMMAGTNWIPNHVWRGFDEEKLVHSHVLIVSWEFLLWR